MNISLSFRNKDIISESYNLLEILDNITNIINNLMR